jgi:L-fucose isomerase-like protein
MKKNEISDEKDIERRLSSLEEKARYQNEIAKKILLDLEKGAKKKK